MILPPALRKQGFGKIHFILFGISALADDFALGEEKGASP